MTDWFLHIFAPLFPLWFPPSLFNSREAKKKKNELKEVILVFFAKYLYFAFGGMRKATAMHAQLSNALRLQLQRKMPVLQLCSGFTQ